MHNCDNNSITSSSTNYLNFIFGWENNPWRGRPLHVLIGTLGAPILSPVALISNYYLKDKIHSSMNKKKILKKLSTYFSFYFFHLIILFFIIFIVCNFLNFSMNSLNYFLISLVILSSDLVVSFFWQTHSSFLLILIPVLSVLSFYVGAVGQYVAKSKFYLYCLFLGCGCLFYQMCILWLPMLIIGYIYSANMNRNINFFEITKILLFFLIPLILWICFCYFFELKIFYEAKWNFVWLFDLLQTGDFKILEKKYYKFIENFKESFRKDILILLIPVLLYLISEKKKIIKSKLGSIFTLVCFLVITFQISFHFLQGYYQPRTINVLSLIIFIWVLWLNKSHLKIKQFTIISILFVQLYNMFTKIPLTFT